MWNITLCSHDTALTGQIRCCYTFFYPSTAGMLSEGPMIPSWSGQGGPRANPGQDGEGGCWLFTCVSSQRLLLVAREWWDSELNAPSLSQPRLTMVDATVHRGVGTAPTAGRCRTGLLPAGAWFVSPPLPPLVPWGRGGQLAGRALSETSETADPRAPA